MLDHVVYKSRTKCDWHATAPFCKLQTQVCHQSQRLSWWRFSECGSVAWIEAFRMNFGTECHGFSMDFPLLRNPAPARLKIDGRLAGCSGVYSASPPPALRGAALYSLQGWYRSESMSLTALVRVLVVFDSAVSSAPLRLHDISPPVAFAAAVA